MLGSKYGQVRACKIKNYSLRIILDFIFEIAPGSPTFHYFKLISCLL